MLIDLDSWVHAVTIRSLKQSPHAVWVVPRPHCPH